MRTLLLLVMLLSSAITAGGGQFTYRYDTMVTTDGHEYQRVKPQRIEGNQLVFFHSSGIGRADLLDLPDNVLADIGLPTRADREHAAKEKAQFEAEQRNRKDKERRRQQSAKKR